MHSPRVAGKKLNSVLCPRHGDPDGPLAKPLLTVNELCRLLGISPRWIHERTRRREIPCYRFGTALRFDLDEIRQWMARFHAHSNGVSAETWRS